MSMKPRKPIPASITRWGMLITTIVLGAVLIGMGVAGYLGAQSTAESLTRARSLDLMFSVRQALRQSGGDHQSALDEVLEQSEEQGLRYIAVVTGKRGAVVTAGQPGAPVEVELFRRTRPGQRFEIASVENRVRVVAALAPGRGAGLRHGWREPLLQGKRGWNKSGVARGEWGKGSLRNKQMKRGARGSGAVLLLEYEPVIAEAIVSRALVMLLVSVIAATVLIVAAGIFWRLSRRAEVMGDQLARDRQLKALGEMSAVLGHELRNPLASLKGHAQLLQERLGEDHPGRRGADFVVREAIRMEKLTGQILEFARTGAVDMSPEDPADVARTAVLEAGLSGVEASIEEGLPSWSMDRLRIERVLINLLKNADQASPEGDEEGAVDFTVALSGGGLLFEVRDRGEGIPEGEEEWIFEPFHTKRVHGTGLGLAVSKRIVEAHKGTISARNHPDGGALFRVWLPPAAQPSS